MRAYGLTVFVNGLLWIGEGLLLAGALFLGSMLSGFGDAGRTAKSSAPALDPSLVAAAFLVGGVIAVSWGAWALLARHMTRTGVVMASVFLVIMILFALAASLVWLGPWFLVALSVVAYARWLFMDYQERMPGSPWRVDEPAPPPASEVPSQPNRRIEKMVESLKGGLDRKSGDVESWH